MPLSVQLRNPRPRTETTRSGLSRVRAGLVVSLLFVFFLGAAPVVRSEVLFQDGFDSVTTGSPPAVPPWSGILDGAGRGQVLVVADADDVFGAGPGSPMLELRADGQDNPMALRALHVFSGAQVSGVVTFSFLLVEPEDEGFPDWVDLYVYAGPTTNDRAQRIMIGRGGISHAGLPGHDGGATYARGGPVRVEIVVNNGDDPVDYADGSTVAPGTFDIWIDGVLRDAGISRDNQVRGGITGFDFIVGSVRRHLLWIQDFQVLRGARIGEPFEPPPPGIYYASTPSEIQAIMRDHAGPGDTVVMRNGIWNSATVTFEGDGTEAAPITLRAETPGEVILTGQSRLRIGGSHLVADGLLFTEGHLTSGSVVEFRTSGRGHATDSRLTNTGFVRYNSPDRTHNYKWVSLFGRRNRVDHCRFVGMDHVGQAVTVWIDSEPNHHRIDHNFFGPRPPLGMNGGEMMRIGDSGTSMYNSRTVVEYNLFFECDGEGEIISSKSNENVFRHNTFIRSAGALTLRHGKRNRVEGNWFFGDNKPDTGGVRAIDEGHVIINNYFHALTGRGFRPPLGLMSGKPDAALHEYFPAHDAVVAHNTFVDCERPVIIALGAERPELTLPPENVLMANNIITATVGPTLEIRDPDSEVHWAANLVFGATVGIPRADGVEQADPMLTRGPDGIWRPLPGSPAQDAAAGITQEVSEDIEGVPRGEPADIGSHVIGTQGSGPMAPVGFLDVGPEWMRSGWETWVGTNFSAAEVAEAGRVEPGADPDHTGVSNLLRYAFGAGRTETPDGWAPRVTETENGPVLEYRRNAAATELELVVEISNDLRDWNPIDTAAAESYTEGDVIFKTVSLSGVAEYRSLFVRIRVVRSEPEPYW